MCVCAVHDIDGFLAATPGDCGAAALSPLLTSHPHPSWERVSMSPSSFLLISRWGDQSLWGVWERKRLQALLEELDEDEQKKEQRLRRVRREFQSECVKED